MLFYDVRQSLPSLSEKEMTQRKGEELTFIGKAIMKDVA